MSETGIEMEKGYAQKERQRRIDAGVGLLVWLAVYAAAVAVVLMDLMVWRQG